MQRVTFHIEMDGVTLTGSLALPSTGRNTVFARQTLSTISLSASQKIMRIYREDNGTKLNWVQFSSSADASGQ